MLTQRELPRMALIQPTLRHSDLVLRAPGMLALHLQLNAVEEPTRVRVWDDVVKAYDMGGTASQWFSDFLGHPGGRKLRLVRFDPEQKRLSNPRWAGTVEAENGFADAYPLLVTNAASLAELNGRLARKGVAAAVMERFRPNLVLHGLEAFAEDTLSDIVITTDEGPVTLRLVKPCIRCTIPNVDPATAQTSHEPGDTLATYRADPRVDGGVTFGMNAVIVDGFERVLRVGQSARASWGFD